MQPARIRSVVFTVVLLLASSIDHGFSQTIHVERLVDSPIIRPEMDGRMGSNIAGPSLIRVPDWIENPLGRYYLYFSDHRGLYIRLAYADELTGPWTTYEPGTLQIEQSHFPTSCPPCLDGTGTPTGYGAYPHVASPDVHVSRSNPEASESPQVALQKPPVPTRDPQTQNLTAQLAHECRRANTKIQKS